MKAIYTVDPNHSTVGFSAKHMMVTTVHGRFTEWSGQVEVEDDNLATVEPVGEAPAAERAGQS